MLAPGIYFERIWVAGYLIECGDFSFFCLYGIVFAEAWGVITLVPTSSIYLGLC